MALAQEGYTPTEIGVDGSATIPVCRGVGPFAAKTAGTITVTGAGAAAILTAWPVQAGVVYPFMYQTFGAATITLAGGASGTIGTY